MSQAHGAASLASPAAEVPTRAQMLVSIRASRAMVATVLRELSGSRVATARNGACMEAQSSLPYRKQTTRDGNDGSLISPRVVHNTALFKMV
jgi:hypothetical protein